MKAANLVTLLALAVACDSRPSDCNCDDSNDCTGADQVCVRCVCRSTCIDDYDCAFDEVCDAGACLSGARTGDGHNPSDGSGGDGSGGGDDGTGDPGCECTTGEIWWGGSCGTEGTYRRTCRTDGCHWDAQECYETCVPTGATETVCNDSEDDDCDTFFDCADPDCLNQPCGSSATTDCSAADTCDDTGACDPNHLAAGEEGGCPACQDCNGAGACENVVDGNQDVGCDGGDTGCSDADSCLGGECQYNHHDDGTEGDCGTCEDCYGGVCDHVPDGNQDVGCTAGASSNGCSAADTCVNGTCQANDYASGTEGNCAVCKDCNGSGSCTNVSGGDVGCTNNCDYCSGGNCENSTRTCWHDSDHDGYCADNAGFEDCSCGAWTCTSRGNDCNDAKPDMNPGAGYSSSPRNCNGDWDCDCNAGIQQDRSEVYISCNPTGSCPSECVGVVSTSCGASGYDDCAGCASCSVGSTVSIGCK